MKNPIQMNHMSKYIMTLLVASICQLSMADEVVVKQYNYSGPHRVKTPFLTDSTDVQGRKYTEKELLKTKLPLLTDTPEMLTADPDGQLILPASDSNYSLHLLSFFINSDTYGKATLEVKGPEMCEIFIDGQSQKSGTQATLTVEPRRYSVAIKYLSKANQADTLKVLLNADGRKLSTSTAGKRNYILSDVTDGRRIQAASVSPDGKFVIVSYLETLPGGRQSFFDQIVDRSNGRTILNNGNHSLQWMPRSNRAYYTRQGMKGKELVAIDPVSKAERILATDLPDGSFRMAPTEDYLLFTVRENGPKERKDIQEVLVPDDRQPGWRNRSFIHKYDLTTGLYQRLTYGHTSTMINDISADGQSVLFSCREPFLTERPFSRTSLYRMDLQTMAVDTILKSAKFISRAAFSPDGSQLLIAGSGDAFNGIGLNITEGQVSNTSDGQLFLYSLSDGQVKALTKDFNPSVDRAEWNGFDKLIYVMAKDRDYVRLYTIDVAKGNIRQLPVKEDVVAGISLSTASPSMVYFGMSASNSQRLYVHDLKKNSSSCIEDLSKELLEEVQLGEVKEWNFISALGDTIYGRYYLPPGFDPEKKYPLIVNYYGGTTPIARTLESRYPAHVYAGMGFIVYVLQPSGATGFGQEFSARHVNAWGKYTADEIIEGTKRFCAEHRFVNSEKVGCMGASYGGFMTMYLQTKTDIFAAAMSHAGISDITSYWGEGYWGYSYSALASANSYPWNARDMYTLQSPLFQADKINTPILFLHGAADTNVPVGESIQMFTALKLLGKPTAFVQVEGENHHILHYDKRIYWNNSIYAWFFKWLKDEPAWWDALYPPKNL